MSNTVDQSSFSAALKTLYPPGTMITDQTLTENPLWGLVPKETDFYGSNHPVPINTQPAVGSNTFSYAQSDQHAAEPRAFLVTTVDYYSLASVSGKTMRASKTDMGAFVTAAKWGVDKAIQKVLKDIARDLYRSGTGSIGQINSSGLSTGVFTLANPTDAKHFFYGQVLQCTNGTTDGNTPRAAVGYVKTVNADTGAITVSSDAVGGAAATPTSWAASEYLLPRGNSNLALTGLEGWAPTTAPTSSLFGVDRSEDPIGYGGYRFDGAALPIQEAIVTGMTRAGAYGATITHGFMNNRWRGALINALGAKVTYADISDPTGKINFKALEVYGDSTTVRIVADPNCPAAKFWGLTLSELCLRSSGEAVSLADYGNGEAIGIYNADAGEMRVVSYLQLECAAPGWQLNCSLAATI